MRTFYEISESMLTGIIIVSNFGFLRSPKISVDCGFETRIPFVNGGRSIIAMERVLKGICESVITILSLGGLLYDFAFFYFLFSFWRTFSKFDRSKFKTVIH